MITLADWHVSHFFLSACCSVHFDDRAGRVQIDCPSDAQFLIPDDPHRTDPEVKHLINSG